MTSRRVLGWAALLVVVVLGAAWARKGGPMLESPMAVPAMDLTTPRTVKSATFAMG